MSVGSERRACVQSLGLHSQFFIKSEISHLNKVKPKQDWLGRGAVEFSRWGAMGQGVSQVPVGVTGCVRTDELGFGQKYT